MCGICGKFNFDGSPVEKGLLHEMNRAMIYRGPNVQKIYTESGLGLGHCRLSIIDLSETANQPMKDTSGRYVLTYNGEIYNFFQIREELNRLGISFLTSSDSEVLLEAYKQWGPACLEKFQGMFAFAIWDTIMQELFLARDRFGVKPLYYYLSPKSFLFASEIQVLLKDRDCSKELSLEGLNTYLAFNYIPNEHTIYKKIKKLRPGHFLIINKKGFTLQKWYDLQDKLKRRNAPKDFISACEEVRSLFQKAVEKRLISDVPLGAFLSGGIDSSLVVAIMSQCSSRPKTFTIGYKDHSLYDETEYARFIANKFGTEHQEFLLSHGDILKIIPNLLNAMGEPFGDPSLLPTFVLSHHTSQMVTVALSGDAGDEVFGGYRKYSGELLVKHYLKLPIALRVKLIPALVKILPSSRDFFMTDRIRQLKKFLYGIKEKQHERHCRWMEVVHYEVRDSLLRENNYATDENILDMIQKMQGEWSDQDYVNKMLFTDLSCCLPYNMFYKVDMASMLNSLEVRSPFIDQDLVEFAFSLPGNYKLGMTRRKYILLEAFSHLLPKKIRKRPKHGFDIPIGEWFRKQLKELFYDVMFQNQDPILDTKAIKKIYDDHISRREDHSFPLWNLFVLKWWLQKNVYARN